MLVGFDGGGVDGFFFVDRDDEVEVDLEDDVLEDLEKFVDLEEFVDLDDPDEHEAPEKHDEPDTFDEHDEPDEPDEPEELEVLEHVLVPRLPGIVGGFPDPHDLIERGGDGILDGGVTGPVGGAHGNPVGLGGLAGYGAHRTLGGDANGCG
jgi:hypothetical protein